MQNRIKQIRKHFGLSQTQFAEKICKTSSFVSDLENGKSNASTATIQAICSVFGINEAWLISGKGNIFAEGQEVEEPDKENVGIGVKRIRKKAALTQEQFCQAIGYSKMQISLVELGRTTPSNTFLQRVATAFKVNYEWLLTGSGKIEAEEAVVDEKLIEWLKKNPDVVKELKIRGGLE